MSESLLSTMHKESGSPKVGEVFHQIYRGAVYLLFRDV